MTVGALDLGDIFYLLLDDAGVYIHYRKVMATTTPLAPALKIFLLMALVFLDSLALMDEKLLLATRCISKRGVSRLRLFGILLLFFGGLISSEISEIYLTDTCGQF